MQTEEQVREHLAQLNQRREGLIIEINRQLGLIDGQRRVGAGLAPEPEAAPA